MKRRYMIIISLIIFFLFLTLYLTNNVNGIDNIMYDFIISIKSDALTKIMKIITFFGGTKFIIFLMVIFLILSFFKGKIFNIINILIIGETLLNNVAKIIVRRQRPTLINLVTEKSFSFPSGHTMVSVTFYGFLIYLLLNSKLNKKIKYLLIGSLIILICLIIISRIYLGAHYFSDCIAGIFLALAYLLLSIDILERKKLI